MAALAYPNGRWWRRLERRAIAGYQQDVLEELRTRARVRTPVAALSTDRARPFGVVRVHLDAVALTMAGLAAPTLEAVLAIGHDGPLFLVGAGRYGRYWWIELAGQGESTVLTSTHTRLTRFQGKIPAAPDAPSKGCVSMQRYRLSR